MSPWLLALLLLTQSIIIGVVAINSTDLRKLLHFARGDAADQARDYLKTPEARELIARAARSVAKDYIQERVESTGEPYIR